jgi:hypothetical protein
MRTIEQTSTRELLALKTGAKAGDYELVYESTLHLGSDKMHISIYYGSYEASHIVVTRYNKNDINCYQSMTFEDAANKVARFINTGFENH